MTFFALLGRLPAHWRFAWSRGLRKKLGRDTKSNGLPEFGHEELGHGWQHPKLHPSLVQPISSLSDARF